MTARFDAAIVGGGPAGAMAARYLAKRGWRVVLIERGGRNRPKTCGHVLAAKAQAILCEAGLSKSVQAMAVGQATALRVHAAGASSMQAPISNTGDLPALVVPRDRFDQLLRNAAEDAGATVMHSATAQVRRIQSDGAVLNLRTRIVTSELECRLLIGADGVGSSIARAAGLNDQDGVGRKYGFAFDIPSSPAERILIARGTIEMFVVPGGYLGAVRQSDDVLHLAGLVAAAGDGESQRPADFLARVARLYPAVASALAAFQSAGHRIRGVGPMPWRPRDVCAGRIALVGDAAGYVEPFTGEGMTWALQSAKVLDHAIDAAGGAWNEHACDMYRSMWRDQIQKRQRWCRWIAVALERPLVSRWMVRAGRALPPITRRMVREVVSA